jgi:protein-tyrosine phosphatase
MNGITSELYSEILPGLFMGGTADDDVVDVAKPLRNLNEEQNFDSVVTCYSWAQPMSWYVHENRFGFADGPMDEETFAKVDELATWLHSEWKNGKRCLSRCQAGLNRSGAVISLVLQKEGFSAEDSISLIRTKRSPHALFNRHFVERLTAYSREEQNSSNKF